MGQGRPKGGFYDTLEWMPDGKQLWDRIAPLEPKILTGMPMGNWAEGQKRNWCARELGIENARVITCMARDKWRQAGPRAILIDDRDDLGVRWQQLGGTFVHHTSTDNTLEELEKLGVFDSSCSTKTNNVNNERAEQTD